MAIGSRPEVNGEAVIPTREKVLPDEKGKSARHR